MERSFFIKHKAVLLSLILIIFYTVGVFGLSTSWREEFLELSAYNLMLSFILLLLSHKAHRKDLYVFITGAFLIGLIAEWIGVHTGYLFGAYAYGESLGFKVWEVPLIIGINWVMLTMISASCVAFLPIKWYFKAFLGALLMLLLDLLIEPIAILSDYWTWEGDIPLYNFVSWFVIALLLQGWYFKANLAESNRVGMTLYVLQVLFFGILLITLT